MSSHPPYGGLVEPPPPQYVMLVFIVFLRPSQQMKQFPIILGELKSILRELLSFFTPILPEISETSYILPQARQARFAQPYSMLVACGM